jgi:hypothetical protein
VPASTTMLSVDVVREVPEAAKPRTIKIGTTVATVPKRTAPRLCERLAGFALPPPLAIALHSLLTPIDMPNCLCHREFLGK